jgi:menaquinone-9 beta-reductase
MSAPRMEKTDILIAGAGPAGCAAGILLAREGFRVTLLEKRPASHRKICGDLLGPRTLWLLKDLRIGWEDKGWVGTSIRSIQVFDEKGRTSWAPFCPPGLDAPPPAETVQRDRFDRYLQGKAVEAGCSIHYQVCFRSVVARHGKDILCRATEEGVERLFKARILLGADGAGSSVAGSITTRARNPRKRILAARAYFREVQGLRDSVELYFCPRYFPGYAWVIPVGAREANIGLGLRADACVRKGVRLRSEVERFTREHPTLSRRMQLAQPDGPIRAWTIGTYEEEARRSAAHVLLLGDAGHFSDPLSGEGIHSALKSACLAVPIVCRAFEQGDFSGGMLSGYDRLAERHFASLYRYAGWLSSLPIDHRLLSPLVRWGLNQVGKNSLMDPGYAMRVGGFFTGTVPGEKMWNAKWLLRTFLG